ncbi:MAG: DUF488 domain-containing protein [Ignavibacteriae bacterium]|nr:MAG: DUF488 domain-containing protein [Ignavibacteriota bacterium]
MEEGKKNTPIIFTIGHSTRPLDAFTHILQSHAITRVVDVRTIPRSRHNPQYNHETLPAALKEKGVEYTHMAGLGGLRRAQPDGLNAGWHNPSFKGFADYMQTKEFSENLELLMERSQHETAVLMCAEAVPWRCHRSLIADALLVHGRIIEDIIGSAPSSAHVLTPWAYVDGFTVTYPADAAVRYENLRPRKLNKKKQGNDEIP